LGPIDLGVVHPLQNCIVSKLGSFRSCSTNAITFYTHAWAMKRGIEQGKLLIGDWFRAYVTLEAAMIEVL